MIQNALSGADIVHAHGVRAAAVVRVAKKGLRRLVRVANRIALNGYDAILTLSESDRAAISAERVARPERVITVTPTFQAPALSDRSAARALFGFAEDDLVILWVGRFVRQKDPLTFVQAIGPERPGRALMVGDGELWEQARTSAQMSRIVFTGWLPDPAAAYSASDIFVSTSLWEGLPITVLEAAAAGLPIILSEVPGHRDLVDLGLPALLFEAGDDVDLSAQLGALGTDREQIRGLGEEARAFVSATFDPRHLRRELIDVYQGDQRRTATT
jgi:glycosyltransferase involved in cell wall biosynthesis